MTMKYIYRVISATYRARAPGITAGAPGPDAVARIDPGRVSPLAKVQHEMAFLTLLATVTGVGIALLQYSAGGPPPSPARPIDDVEVGNLVDSVGMAGIGLVEFKKHVDDPSANELRKSVGPGVIQTGLLAFPSLQEAASVADPFQAQF